MVLWNRYIGLFKFTKHLPCIISRASPNSPKRKLRSAHNYIRRSEETHLQSRCLIPQHRLCLNAPWENMIKKEIPRDSQELRKTIFHPTDSRDGLFLSSFLNGILEKGEKVDEETLGHFALVVEGLLSGPRRGKVRRLESMMLPQPGADGDKGFWGQVFLRTSLDVVTIVCLWEVMELSVALVLSYIKRNKSNFVVKNSCDNPWQTSSLEAGM